MNLVPGVSVDVSHNSSLEFHFGTSHSVFHSNFPIIHHINDKIIVVYNFPPISTSLIRSARVPLITVYSTIRHPWHDTIYDLIKGLMSVSLWKASINRQVTKDQFAIVHLWLSRS